MMKEMYEGLLREDIRGKWVWKHLVKLRVSKLRFDD